MTLPTSDLERLIGYALLADAEYRRWLVRDPQAAAASIGITLNEAEAEHIHNTVTLRRLNAMAKSINHWMPPRTVSNWQKTPLKPE